MGFVLFHYDVFKLKKKIPFWFTESLFYYEQRLNIVTCFSTSIEVIQLASQVGFSRMILIH